MPKYKKNEMNMNKLASTIMDQLHSSQNASRSDTLLYHGEQVSDTNTLAPHNVSEVNRSNAQKVSPVLVAEESTKENTGNDAQGKLALKEDESLVDMVYLRELLSVSDKLIYKMMKNKQFPRPVKISRSSRWILREVKQWLDERANSR
ncbi:Rha family transcriptional regulator (modular protein) [Enterobacterales bacterium 8AC]|nr:Rha family transcriptional regulator (modular protein) [Enterobacterales bacterium 8AC]